MALILGALMGPRCAEGRELSPKLKAALDNKIALLQHEITGDPLIVQAVRDSNEKTQGLSMAEILELDRQWQATSGINEFIKVFLINPCAYRLIKFQDTQDGYSEVFIANVKGLVVCETNKTSDYYQADEDWWVTAYDKGRGRTFYGGIEYDQSAMTEAIPIAIPVMDPDTHQAIGVIKAVLDIASIQMEL